MKNDESPFEPLRSRPLIDEVREMVRGAVERMVAEDPDISLDGINAGLARASMQYNRRPQRDLGGLSPDGMRLLLQDPWDGGGVMRLDTQIPLRDLAASRTLVNARVLLGYLAERGEVPATATRGHLTRAALADLAPRMSWDDAFPWNEVLQRRGNEEDLFPLHALRLLLGLAGLVKVRKRKFSLTARGRRMLDDDRAGELHALLFRTQFREMNLAFLYSYGPALPGLQHTIAFTLLRLKHVATDWKTPQRLATETLHPAVREEFDELPPWMEAGSILRGRVLEPLADFGLLRLKETERRGRFNVVRHFRKSALFDRFVRFSFPH